MTGWKLRNDDWQRPMTMVQDLHNQNAKTILGTTIVQGQSGEEDLEAFIDILCGHQNIAPFIAKFFIRKMVTSNPSHGYVERVANAFNNSGLEMLALIKAVLTDDEATYSRQDEHDGLVRDPLIVFQHGLRALNVKLKNNYTMLPDAFSWHNRRTILEGQASFTITNRKSRQRMSASKASLRPNLSSTTGTTFTTTTAKSPI
ncbi:DUF1800 family protein [Vibrio mexicanus]|uniref:DUF1800 family protein n=1 Tax=Vibrio mexicanus TaxID=1004326 RepID=UPI00063C7B47|nr:DUF1800 family protein [Vibrio mexicanus]